MKCKDRLHHGVRLLLCALALLASTGAVAALDQYDVEVIVFSNDAAAGDDENTQEPGTAGRPAAGAVPASEFIELSAADYRLNNIRGGLASARGYRVLFHRAWRQPVYDRAHAIDYPVHGVAAGGRSSVDGTVTLIRERFLHLDVDLLLQTSAGNGMPAAFRLNERRRIRSDELHYFDHPRFGVIARVTPYAAAAEPAAVAPDAGAGSVEDGGAAGMQEEEPVEGAPAGDQLTR